MYAICCFSPGTIAEGAPVVPISAQLKYNIEVICEYICKKIPVPVRDFTSSARLIVIRSFDVNKPGCEVEELKGGVAGGSILCGVLRVLVLCMLFSELTRLWESRWRVLMCTSYTCQPRQSTSNYKFSA